MRNPDRLTLAEAAALIAIAVISFVAFQAMGCMPQAPEPVTWDDPDGCSLTKYRLTEPSCQEGYTFYVLHGEPWCGKCYNFHDACPGDCTLEWISIESHPVCECSE